MALVKKVDPEWFPSEAPELKVGEEVEIGDAEQLLNEGKVELADGPKDSVASDTSVGEATELKDNQCAQCKFIAKSSGGLLAHKRSHK